MGGIGMDEGEQRWETICQAVAAHQTLPSIIEYQLSQHLAHTKLYTLANWHYGISSTNNSEKT